MEAAGRGMWHDGDDYMVVAWRWLRGEAAMEVVMYISVVEWFLEKAVGDDVSGNCGGSGCRWDGRKNAEALSESKDGGGGHWKSRSKKKKSNKEEDDLPSHIKTYDGSEDPEDHLKIFQAVVKIERWAIPTSCHMFNSTLTGNARVWFDDLPAESIDSYDDLKKAFLENYLQHKKCIKDPIEIHNIKQRDGESTEDFVKRYKLEIREVKRAP
ncbi:reverse transcriptase domain-containing protein [Tanacetum coccineum]